MGKDYILSHTAPFLCRVVIQIISFNIEIQRSYRLQNPFSKDLFLKFLSQMGLTCISSNSSGSCGDAGALVGDAWRSTSSSLERWRFNLSAISLLLRLLKLNILKSKPLKKE